MVIDSLELQVLSILRDRTKYLRYGNLFNEELFESYQTKFFYKLIGNFHHKHKSDLLTIRSLRILLNSEAKPTELPKFRGYVRRIKLNSVKDDSVADGVLRKFAERQRIKQAVLEAIDSLDKGEEADYERIKQKIDEAIKVKSSNAEESYNYFGDSSKRVLEESTEVRIPTGYHEIDQAMNGGLGPGEIGILVGPTGIGKTMMLVNIGYKALVKGKKVVHATLEIRPRKAARRYDVRISGHSWTDIKETPRVLHKRVESLKKIGAGLQIKDYTSSLCSVIDLRSYLERVREKGFDFDLVIVDHADLMYTPKQYKERRYELSSIIAGLRRMASEFGVPIWTASQATRKSGEEGKTRLWDIAEDIGKANWADFVITISQDEGQKEEGVAYLHLVKTREDGGNPRVMVNIDYSTMAVRSNKKEVKELVSRNGHVRN